jgi:hypothetical protein
MEDTMCTGHLCQICKKLEAMLSALPRDHARPPVEICASCYKQEDGNARGESKPRPIVTSIEALDFFRALAFIQDSDQNRLTRNNDHVCSRPGCDGIFDGAVIIVDDESLGVADGEYEICPLCETAAKYAASKWNGFSTRNDKALAALAQANREAAAQIVAQLSGATSATRKSPQPAPTSMGLALVRAQAAAG